MSTSSFANEDSGENMTINENENENTKLELFLKSVRNIVKEAKHNDESLYPELKTVASGRDLYIWLNNHYMCFYKVFQADLLKIMHEMANERMN
jgi:hypothetical protein